MPFHGKISNCYDSHCHWAATGEMLHTVQLGQLQSALDVTSIPDSKIHKKADWIIGFGWDENNWPEKSLPHRSTLDRRFPGELVSFSRADGHASWVSSRVLEKLGWLNSAGGLAGPLPQIDGGEIVVDANGVPTGVLTEKAKAEVDRLLPENSAYQMNSYLIAGMASFHKYGITHIRDMTCSEQQWNEMLKLEASGLLKLAVEQTFSAETPDMFDSAYDLAKRALKVKTRLIRKVAMKVYYDGALGSEGAYLSQPYLTSGKTGLKLLERDQLQGFMRKSWEVGLALAVHAIGDQAAHDVVVAAVDLWDRGFTGELNLEHAEILRSETLKLMRGRRIRCFLQPCHYHSDKAWLEKKLPKSLLAGVFPWADLEEIGIPIHFGSDTPIEPADISLNFTALEKAQELGIRAPKHDFSVYQSHPDKSWIPNCFSIFKDGKLTSMKFDGEQLLMRP